MTNQHGDFIWYELLTTDADGAQKFYSGLLGWEYKGTEQPEVDYRLSSMNGIDIGGLMQITPEMEEGGARPLWAGYIGVDDIDSAVTAVTGSGGQVLIPPQDIPDVGRFAFIMDPQGAPFYIMKDMTGQTSESFSSQEPKMGHCAWNELISSDPAGAQNFYGENFGWVKADSIDMGPMGQYELYKNGADREFMFGGMMQKNDEMPVSLWIYYFRVQNIDTAHTYITENGGQIVNGPMEIPGGEFIINGVDPQGAFFAVIGSR